MPSKMKTTLVERSVSEIKLCMVGKSSIYEIHMNERRSLLCGVGCVQSYALYFCPNTGVVLEALSYDASLYVLFIVHSR
jgi:hypothetical protein